MRDFLYRYGPTMAWALLLFGVSSIPDLSFPLHISRWDDKWEHALAYMPLGWFLMRSLTWQSRRGRNALWLTIIIGTLYGISDEIHQYFVPGRFMDWRDAVADAIGITLGAWFFYRWQQHKQLRERQSAPKMKRAVSISK